MFTETDYDKLEQIMEESPEKRNLLLRLLESHRMEVSSISHEIRNPLTLVYSTLQLIESAHPEVHNFRHWDSLHQDIEYMTQLLEELSSYNNGERLNISSIDTDTFLKSLALSFAASLADTNIEFTSRINYGLPCIKADSVKIRALILNLLKNAREAVVQNNTHPCITFHAYLNSSPSGDTPNDSFHTALNGDTPQSGACLTITVSDNGAGIPPENLEHIFEPFRTWKKGGTGLGLAVARRIAKAHGGTLNASSDPGVNTVFTLSLPV